MNQQDTELLNKLSISAESLSFIFGDRTISQGINYFKLGKVITMQILTNAKTEKLPSNKIIIFSVVQGSGRKKHQTQLTINKKEDYTQASSNCSCTKRFDCKHGIATLFNYLAGLNISTNQSHFIKQNNEVNNWLKDLAKIEQNKQIISIDKRDYLFHLIFILTLEEIEQDQPLFCIQCVKCRPLKKGGYGANTHIDFYQLSDPYYKTQGDIYYEKTDLEILSTMETLEETEDYQKDKYILQGEIAELVLIKALKTNRLFWHKDKSTPLIKGTERVLQFYWQKEKDHFIIKGKAEPDYNAISFIEKLHYFDFERYEIGLIIHQEMSSIQVMAFLNAPPIPEPEAAEISKKLLHILPEIDLPLPVESVIETKEISQQAPHIKLILKTVLIDDKSLHIASLAFEYEKISYQPKNQIQQTKNPVVFIEEEIRYKLHRDLMSESMVVQQLQQLGLNNIENNLAILTFTDSLLLSEEVLAWDYFRNQEVPQLVEQGWEIIIDDSFDLEIGYIDDWVAEIEESSGGNWFEMVLGFEFNGQKVNLLPLLVELLAENPDTAKLHENLKQKEHQLFQLSEHKWVQIPTPRILTILDTVIELYDSESLNKSGNFEFSKYEGLNYGLLLNDPKLKWQGAEELRKLTQKISQFSGIANIPLPKGLKAELRDYQQAGYNWLQFLREYQFNGILADDMGLGKTVQALTHLLIEKETGRAKQPNLIIAPTSLMSNWRREVEKFTPDLSVLILQGMDRKKYFNAINDYDIVLTTYPLMRRDQDLYKDIDFHYLILDEAQAIKNAKTKTTQLIYKLNANHRLCVTGTPIENHLGELWSMFHFLMPGYLGTNKRFNQLFRKPIEKEGDGARGLQLRNRVEPFMLRRTKDLVAKELPEKTEMIRSIPLSGKQRDLYETVRLAMDKKVREEIKKKGLARSHIMILDALLKLRQVCCDPRLVKLDKAKKVKESAKLDLLMDMVPEMVEEGRKILIFSQFTSMLSLIEDELNKHQITFSKLTGQTKKREEAINLFQEGDAKVFLISLKAGGVGLNLTAADTVIHYDPWWNPAVEQQATDRAHRIGQDKPVFVFKLITEETVEEKIIAMQAKKQALADALYGGKEQNKLKFGQDELMALLSPLD